MYKIYVDGHMICSSKLDELALIDPVVELEVNKAGSFVFTFPSDHAYRDYVDERKSIIDVYQDADLVFEGIATEVEDDMYGQRTVTCEGELTFLNDSIQRQAHYTTQTPAQLLAAYISAHNSQVDSWKHFTVGSVTVNGSATCFTNYNSTMTEIGEDLINDFGGYLRVRHQDGVRYLDYLAESPNTNSQTIALGKNIINLKSNISTLDVCTVLIPLGAKQENEDVPGLESYLTIKSVNDNKDYLENASAIANMGKITQVVHWDDVTVASNLKTKGQQYLTNAQYANLVIEVTAFDLGLASDVFDKFKLLDTVRIISEPHGLDKNMMITKLTLNLSAPESNTITLGASDVQSISARTANVSNELFVAEDSAYSRAVATATALITSAMGGYVYKTTSELFIMDTNDPATAQKVWRWNLNGLGYSSTGINGPYGLAMTMDGSIVADYITSGTLEAIDINGVNITGSTFQAGRIITRYASDYSQADQTRLTDIMLGRITPTQADYEHLDLNKDGRFDSTDSAYISYLLTHGGSVDIDATVRIDGDALTSQIIKVGGFTKVGASDIESQSVRATSDFSSYSNGVRRVMLTPSGLSFYDANGNTTKFYPAT